MTSKGTHALKRQPSSGAGLGSDSAAGRGMRFMPPLRWHLGLAFHFRLFSHQSYEYILYGMGFNEGGYAERFPAEPRPAHPATGSRS